MKRLLLLALMSTLLTGYALSEDRLPLVMSSDIPATDRSKPNYDDDRDYANFVGRLYVDDMYIDVALYRSNSQEVVDRKDSAAYFDLSSARGNMIIADHNTHAFSSLGIAKKGTVARLVREDGVIEYYECIDIFKGHNTGKGITDWSGKSVIGKAELMMYTCFDGWQNVWVVLWEKTLSDEKTEMQHPLNRFSVNMDAYLRTLLSTKYTSVTSEGWEEIELTLLDNRQYD